MSDPKPSTGACRHDKGSYWSGMTYECADHPFVGNKTKYPECPLCGRDDLDEEAPSPSESPNLMAPNTAEIRRFDLGSVNNYIGARIESTEVIEMEKADGKYVLWTEHLAAMKEAIGNNFSYEEHTQAVQAAYANGRAERTAKIEALESQLHDRDAALKERDGKISEALKLSQEGLASLDNYTKSVEAKLKEKDSRIAMALANLNETRKAFEEARQETNEADAFVLQLCGEKLRLEKELAEAKKDAEKWKVAFSFKNNDCDTAIRERADVQKDLAEAKNRIDCNNDEYKLWCVQDEASRKKIEGLKAEVTKLRAALQFATDEVLWKIPKQNPTLETAQKAYDLAVEALAQGDQ